MGRRQPQDILDIEKIDVSSKSLAELLDITPHYVRRLSRDGVIPRAGRDRYPLAHAVQGYLRNLQAPSGEPESRAAGSGLARAREAEILQRIARRAAQLIETEEAVSALDEIVELFVEELRPLGDMGMPRGARGAQHSLRKPVDHICSRLRSRVDQVVVDLGAPRSSSDEES